MESDFEYYYRHPNCFTYAPFSIRNPVKGRWMDGVPNAKRSARPPRKQGGERINNSEKSENQSKLSVILGVSQSEKALKKILRQIEKLCPKEIIVIMNGSNDRSIDLVLSYSTYALKIYIYPFALGGDVALHWCQRSEWPCMLIPRY